MPGGQPRTFPTPEDLDKAVEEYLNWCEENDEVPYMKEFCLRLGKCSDLLEFYKTAPEYSRSIKALKEACELGLAKGALKNKINPTMSIFLLKNNHGMKDKQEVSGDKDAPLTIVSNIPSKKG